MLYDTIHFKPQLDQRADRPSPIIMALVAVSVFTMTLLTLNGYHVEDLPTIIRLWF